MFDLAVIAISLCIGRSGTSCQNNLIGALMHIGENNTFCSAWRHLHVAKQSPHPRPLVVVQSG